jgi:hypothetical protein
MRTGARRVNIDVVLTPEQREYLERCASIRRVATGRLLAMLVETIARDQLVAATLDDEGRPATREKGQHSAPSIRQTTRVPNFGTVATARSRTLAPTRGEMRDQLRRAVEHTQAQTPPIEPGDLASEEMEDACTK